MSAPVSADVNCSVRLNTQLKGAMCTVLIDQDFWGGITDLDPRKFYWYKLTAYLLREAVSNTDFDSHFSFLTTQFQFYCRYFVIDIYFGACKR